MADGREKLYINQWQRKWSMDIWIWVLDLDTDLHTALELYHLAASFEFYYMISTFITNSHQL